MLVINKPPQSVSGALILAISTLQQAAVFIQNYVERIVKYTVADGAVHDHGSSHSLSLSHVTGRNKGAGMEMMMMMQMWFEATTSVTLWFKSWRIQSPLWYSLSILGLVALCLMQEALARYRAHLARQYAATGFQSLRSDMPESLAASTPPLAQRGTPTLAARALLSALYGVNVATSYLLMLAVMTFNVGYYVAIVLGLALGHFVFFPVSAGNTSDLSEACCPQS